MMQVIVIRFQVAAIHFSSAKIMGAFPATEMLISNTD